MEYRLLVNLSILTLNLYGSNSPLPVSVSIFANSLQTLYDAGRISSLPGSSPQELVEQAPRLSIQVLGTLSMAIATLPIDPTGFQIYADV